MRGKAEICAGALALRYEAAGRQGALLRQAASADLSIPASSCSAIADRRRILAVGDSLRTDIAGAEAAGIDSLLVLGGIHQEELAGGDLESIVRRAGVRPTAAVPSFRW